MNANAATEPVRRRTPKRSTDVEVGTRIHQLMWSRQITQTQFAADLGMDQSSLAKKIRGQRGWALDEISAVSELLNVSISALFGEREPENSPSVTFCSIAPVISLDARRKPSAPVEYTGVASVRQLHAVQA